MHVTLGKLPENFVSGLLKSHEATRSSAGDRDRWGSRLPPSFGTAVNADMLANHADWRDPLREEIDAALRADKDFDYSSYSGEKFMAGFTEADVANISRLRTLPGVRLHFSDGEWSLETDQALIGDISLRALPKLQEICEKLHSHPLANSRFTGPKHCPQSMDF